MLPTLTEMQSAFGDSIGLLLFDDAFPMRELPPVGFACPLTEVKAFLHVRNGRRLVEQVQGLATLEEVIRWGLRQPTERMILVFVRPSPAARGTLRAGSSFVLVFRETSSLSCACAINVPFC